MVRLPHHVGDVGEPGRQHFLVLRHAGAVLHQAGDARYVDMPQTLFPAQGGEEGGVLAHVFRVPRHDAVKLGFDLEQFLKLWIQEVKQPVQFRAPQKHHLGAEGDGFRLQAFCREDSVTVPEVFDRDLFVAHRPL